MRRYDHIVFDIDGTLLDTKTAVLSGLQDAVCEVLGVKMPIEELLFSFGIPGEEALRMLGAPDPRAALVVWNRHIRKYWPTIEVFPGAAVTLDALDGCSLGIVTSKTRSEYDVEFCRFDISRHFRTAVTADDTSAHKPRPEPLLKYMELTGAEPGRTLYIGDSVYDMRCAKAAGVDHVLALWGAVNPDIPATYYAKCPEDILNIVGA